MAMIHDSVVLYAKAVDQLLKSHVFQPKPLSCDTNDNWEHGYSIINYMKVVRPNNYSLCQINLSQVKIVEARDKIKNTSET